MDWLEEVRRKHYEVELLLKSEEGARLQALLGRMSPSGGYRVARALKRSVNERIHRLAVIAEIKRRTPTGAPHPTELARIDDMALAALQLADAGADVLMVATDGPCYGGSLLELERTCEALRARDGAPPVVAKDLYIHPVQVAQAVDRGADGVLLMATLLGASLGELLDACTCLGCEALVEVHTPNELEAALVLGATNIVATSWDRVENRLYDDQAKGLRHLIPDLIVAIAAGGISSMEEAAQLGDLGYDAVVLGRGLAAAPDVGRFIGGVREREGMPQLLTGAGMRAAELKSLDP